MLKLRYKSALDGLFVKLQNLKRLQFTAQRWTENSAREFADNLMENLETQGRSGTPPPLSPITKKIYQQDGEPDGSGIRDHIEVKHKRSKNQSISVVGIPRGQPSLVANVQNKGAVIRVTPKMRGWFAARGIYLKPTTKVIRIPARRFWSKAWSKVASKRKAQLTGILRGKSEG